MKAETALMYLRSRVVHVHGDAADLSLIEACDPALLVALESQQRVKVRDEQGSYTRTGTVSRSLGPRPVLLLMHRSNDVGSSDVLCSHDRVVAWWDGKRYGEDQRG